MGLALGPLHKIRNRQPRQTGDGLVGFRTLGQEGVAAIDLVVTEITMNTMTVFLSCLELCRRPSISVVKSSSLPINAPGERRWEIPRSCEIRR